MEYFEMLKESTSKEHLNLICSNRRKCSARFHLKIIEGEIFTRKEGKVYFLHGDEEQILNPENYSDLFHVHSKKCLGEFIILSQV